MYGVIYQTFNDVNGKTYIGQSTNPDNKKYFGSGIKIAKAIKKYGVKNFHREILCECKTKEQLDRMERLYIAILNPDYNISLGGHGFGKHSEESKKKMSLSHIGVDVRSGMKHSEETKKKMSEKRKLRVTSEETKRKMSETRTGKKSLPRSNETKKRISDGLILYYKQRTP